MSGHSKWSTIKHKKAATDKKRSKLWSKLARYVTMAARAGGGDPKDNPRLRLAIDKAKSANMPKDTIEKAIKKGTGDLEGASYEEVLYEGYGPGGVALMAQAITDNRSRTSPEVKKIFERSGGNLGAQHSVSWMFAQKGILTVQNSKVDEEKLMEIVIENGGDDVAAIDDLQEISCEPDAYEGIKAALESAGITIHSAELTMVASNTITPDAETARKVLRLMDTLDDHEDVTSISMNCDFPDEVLAELQ